MTNSEENLAVMKSVVHQFDEYAKTLPADASYQLGRFVVANQCVRLLASSGNGLLSPKEWDFKDFQCAMIALPRMYLELMPSDDKYEVALRMAVVWRNAIHVETLLRQ